jgi:hypothetical protein
MQDFSGVGLYAMRAVVSSLGRWGNMPFSEPLIGPSDRGRWRNPKSFGCGSVRHPVFNGKNQTLSQIIRNGLCHKGWPPSPALILN